MLLRSGSAKVYPEEEIDVDGRPSSKVGNSKKGNAVQLLNVSVSMPSTSCEATTSRAMEESWLKQKRDRPCPLQFKFQTSACEGHSRLLEWGELIEDFDIAIENVRTKSELYRVYGHPLKKTMGESGTSLRHITHKVMNSYGMEFLGIVAEVLMAAVGQRIPLPEVLEQLKLVEFNEAKVIGEKLFIWVDDQPLNEDNNEDVKMGSLCQLLLTDLLCLNMEPEIVITCQDFDPEILVNLVHQVRPHLTEEQRLAYGPKQSDFAQEVILQLLGIGLKVSLASATTKIIIIDADQSVEHEPHFLSLLETAEKLGHTVMYFRNTLITDKIKATEELVEKIQVWFNKRTEVEEEETKRQNEAGAVTTQIEEDKPFAATDYAHAQRASNSQEFRLINNESSNPLQSLQMNIKMGRDKLPQPSAKTPESAIHQLSKNQFNNEFVDTSDSELSD